MEIGSRTGRVLAQPTLWSWGWESRVLEDVGVLLGVALGVVVGVEVSAWVHGESAWLSYGSGVAIFGAEAPY